MTRTARRAAGTPGPAFALVTVITLAAATLGPAAGAARGYEREPEDDPKKVVVTGVDDPRLASFDRLMREFVARHRVPGAALAVTRHGRLVYARGFGFADLDTAEPVRPHALFRIASVSKPLTAVTVLNLIDRGKLKLDDRVLDVLGPRVLGGDGPPADPRWAKVTVREVLQHRGGWDRGASFDPMFRPVRIAREFQAEPPAGPGLIIRSMLRRPLDFDPGARYAYSNFGYCVLGRVIEAVAGAPYGEAVRARVLGPLGVPLGELLLGHTLPEGRLPGEVRYYSKEKAARATVGRPLGRPVPSPYGAWYLEAMDAHGGWVGSAPALLKFASAFDDPARCSVLSPGAIATMFERPPGLAGLRRDGQPRAAFYACGWQVRAVGRDGANTWHAGSLPGTSSILVRRHDGLDWAVLFNSRDTPDGDEPAAAIDRLVHEAADAVREWPDKDLFPGKTPGTGG
jgi:N-acyl-D-amino-acid deacylase